MTKSLFVAKLFAVGVLATGPLTMASSGSQVSRSAAKALPAVEVQELVLDNGFRVLVVEDARVPRVAASLFYRVGALQERQGEHGSTHFLEHAIHQGTTSVGTRNFEAEKPILREIYETEQKLIALWNQDRNRLRERNIFFDELDWPTSPEMERLRQHLYELEDQDTQYREFWAEYNWYRRYGGLMRHTDPVPATTGDEWVEIDIDLPKENLELFFRLEADRMVNAVPRGWEAQRFTVLEQILGRWSRRDTRLAEALLGVSGYAHPVYTRTAWGHLRDFAYFNRASMLRIYDDYFVPNNATLALVGDISLREVRSLAQRYFGRIPRGPEPPARMDLEAEPPPGGAVRLDWLEPLEPRVLIRYRIPAVGHPDRPVFDTIAALLKGPQGMLGAKLLGERGLVPGVDLQVTASRRGTPGAIDLVSVAGRDEDLATIESAMLEVVDELRQGRVDPIALERARKVLRLEWERMRSDRDELAYQLAGHAVFDSWETLPLQMEARLGASLEDIQRAARQYLVPVNRVIATSRLNPR